MGEFELHGPALESSTFKHGIHEIYLQVLHCLSIHTYHLLNLRG